MDLAASTAVVTATSTSSDVSSAESMCACPSAGSVTADRTVLTGNYCK